MEQNEQTNGPAPQIQEPPPLPEEHHSLPVAAWRALLRHFRRAFSWNLQTAPIAAQEKTALLKSGQTNEALQRYAAWRRSILLVVTMPTLFSAVLSTISSVSQGGEGLSRVGQVLTITSTLILYAMPGAALAAAFSWTRLKRSQQFLFLGWIVAFVPPILIAFCPLEWWTQHGGLSEEHTSRRVEVLVYEAMAGLYYSLMLLPTVLSLIPGLIRSCLRVKTLLPASIVPGWFLVAGAPFYLLIWLVALVAMNHLAGNLLLVVGIGLWVSAPMIYVLRAELFVRPILAAECRKIGQVQLVVRVIVGLAFGLLLAYLLTKKVFGLHLIGLDPETSLVWLWQNHEELQLPGEEIMARATSLIWLGQLDLFDAAIEYLSRSLFMTAVFADMLVRMNVSVWHYERQFAGTPAAAEYESVMADMGHALRLE